MTCGRLSIAWAIKNANENIFPQDLKITIANDQSSKTIGQVNDLVNNILFGIILVGTVLMFFLGFKNALFVGFAIPMSMFMSLMILNALGYTLADQTDRLDEARELIGRALALRPEDPYIMDSMGWVEYRLGQLDSAKALLSEAYQVNGDVEIAAHLGEVLWELGELENARSIWSEASEVDADNPILRETLKRYPVSAD